MSDKIQFATTKKFFYEHFIKTQAWITATNCVDYRLVKEGDTLTIAFQQSQGPECYNGRKDWIRNIRCRPKWCHFFKIILHLGFWLGWLKCHSELYYSYTSGSCIPTGIKSIQITCYSQGCGVGMLEYCFLMEQKQSGNSCLKDIEILPPICFAPPAFVWCLFSWRMRKYLKGVRLVRTRKDIVPKVLRWLGYVHIGKNEYLEEPAGYKHPEHIPDWMRGTYHYPEYYMACLPSEGEVKS